MRYGAHASAFFMVIDARRLSKPPNATKPEKFWRSAKSGKSWTEWEARQSHSLESFPGQVTKANVDIFTSAMRTRTDGLKFYCNWEFPRRFSTVHAFEVSWPRSLLAGIVVVPLGVEREKCGGYT